jgi:hypothetical protein
MRTSNPNRRKFISLFLAISVLFAQFAIAGHSLHVGKKSESQSAELTCAFCIAATHLEAGPSAPVVHLEHSLPELAAVGVRNVCERACVVSSRLTRGPPHFSTT